MSNLKNRGETLKQRAKGVGANTVVYFLLICIGFVFLYPLLYMVVTSLMCTEDLINPTIFHTEYKEVKVECRSPIAFGQTIVDLRQGKRGAVPNCYVCLTCDRDKYKDLIFDCVAAYK